MSYDGMRPAMAARARVARLLGIDGDGGAAFSAPMRAPRGTVGGQGSEAPSVNR